MEYQKEAERVSGHSRSQKGRQYVVKMNGLISGLPLSAFKSGCSVTSCEVLVNDFTSLDLSFICKIGTVLPLQTMTVLM